MAPKKTKPVKKGIKTGAMDQFVRPMKMDNESTMSVDITLSHSWLSTDDDDEAISLPEVRIMSREKAKENVNSMKGGSSEQVLSGFRESLGGTLHEIDE